MAEAVVDRKKSKRRDAVILIVRSFRKALGFSVWLTADEDNSMRAKKPENMMKLCKRKLMRDVDVKRDSASDQPL